MNINYRNKFLIKSNSNAYVIYKPQRDSNNHKVKDDEGNQVFSPHRPKNIVHFESLCNIIFIPNVIKTKKEAIFDMKKKFKKFKEQIILEAKDIEIDIPDEGLFLYGNYLLTIIDNQFCLQRTSVENYEIKINDKGEIVYGVRCYYHLIEDVFVSIYEQDVRFADVICVEELDEEVIRIGNEILNMVEGLKGKV